MKTIFAVIIFAIMICGCGHDLSRYEHLKDPSISNKADRNMIVYEIKGSPEETGGEAFTALFSAFYSLKRKHNLKSAAPLARWSGIPGQSEEEWVGEFALPVNASVKNIPEKIKAIYPKLQLKVWKYGETAEILHVGSYDSEDGTIKRLHEFIKDSGYIIIGKHEEEYIKGPGMFFKGNPKKYQTIIRYPVMKKLNDM